MVPLTLALARLARLDELLEVHLEWLDSSARLCLPLDDVGDYLLHPRTQQGRRVLISHSKARAQCDPGKLRTCPSPRALGRDGVRLGSVPFPLPLPLRPLLALLGALAVVLVRTLRLEHEALALEGD